jgi:glycosyltransferase involved in cell wall biosynthesis
VSTIIRERVLINAVNVTGAGARSISLSLIPELVQANPQWCFIVLVPDDEAFRKMPAAENAEILFHQRGRGWCNDVIRLWEIVWSVPHCAKGKKAQVCLTLGDINPAGLPCAGVIFVQQALLAYSRRELAGSRTWSFVKQLIAPVVFSCTVRSAEAVIVQTPVMAGRLSAKYTIPLRKLRVIGQPVPQALRDAALTAVPNPVMSRYVKRTRLFFPARGYPHKNHAILPAVARELRGRGIADNVHIFTTLGAVGDDRLMQEAINGHGDVITNLGALTVREVAGAYRAASAMFLPTLIESYGLIYLEAMYFGLPILTSDRDFAREMCRDQASYFDPQQPVLIVDAIERLMASLEKPPAQKTNPAGIERFPAGWKQVADQFANVLQSAMAGKSAG